MLTSTITVTSKNQITIPVDFIRKLKIKKGSKLVISEKNGVISMQKHEGLLDKYQGFLKVPKNQIIESLEAVLKMDFVQFDQETVISKAIDFFRDNNIDLEDCFHLAYLCDCDNKKIVTFDKKLKLLSP